MWYLRMMARESFLCSAKDGAYNNAIVLEEVIRLSCPFYPFGIVSSDG